MDEGKKPLEFPESPLRTDKIKMFISKMLEWNVVERFTC